MLIDCSLILTNKMTSFGQQMGAKIWVEADRVVQKPSSGFLTVIERRSETTSHFARVLMYCEVHRLILRVVDTWASPEF